MNHLVQAMRVETMSLPLVTMMPAMLNMIVKVLTQREVKRAIANYIVLFVKVVVRDHRKDLGLVPGTLASTINGEDHSHDPRRHLAQGPSIVLMVQDRPEVDDMSQAPRIGEIGSQGIMTMVHYPLIMMMTLAVLRVKRASKNVRFIKAPLVPVDDIDHP